MRVETTVWQGTGLIHKIDSESVLRLFKIDHFSQDAAWRRRLELENDNGG